MTAVRLNTYTRSKPRAKMGSIWDKLKGPTGEPPYRRLPEYHIRVVKIKPSTPKWPVRVKLKIIDPRKTKYTALSYAWEADEENESNDSTGSTRTPSTRAEASHTILCGGTPVKVSKNLYDAIAQLRDIQSDVPIFIDALCINFHNSEERAEMIKIMGHVYSRAASVVVWLGHKGKSGDDVVTIMRKLVNAIDWRRIGDPDSYNFRDPQFFTRIGMEPLTLQQWRGIRHFCHRGWFSRLWAFHELALAKRAIFLYSETCMEYDFLIDFGMILGLSGWLEELEEVTTGEHEEVTTGLTKLLGPVARLKAVPPWHPKHADHATWMKENYGLETETERAWKFFEILLQSAEAFDCRDPRDRIYASLALIRTIFAGQPLNKQWPTPDYDCSIDVVYDHFSALIQKHTHEVSILATASRDEPEKQYVKDGRGRPTVQRVPSE